MYQKAAASGTSEEFLEQRLFYGFRHRILCICMLKEVLQLKISTFFSITLSHFKLFIFNRKEAITTTNKGESLSD